MYFKNTFPFATGVVLFACLSYLTAGNSASEISKGYVLIAPLGSPKALLVDHNKKIVHSWECGTSPGNSTYLLEDGSLLRTGKAVNPVFSASGGAGGNLKKFDWQGNLLWEYELSSETILHHHDVEPLPNGNILTFMWQKKTRQEAIAAGRDPETLSGDSLWPEVVVELKPVGKNDAEIVWQWNLWDHIIQDFDESKANFGDVAGNPGLVDINYGTRRGGADWIHMNSIDYNAGLDQIALSARWFNEVWIIDHATTTEDAAGPKGNLLFRWGNPESYRAGTAEDRRFFAQHDLRWIPEGYPGEGNLTLFNNGERGRPYSSVDEFVPPIRKDGSHNPANSPKDFVWSYEDKENFYSERISGAQRLPGGNTLVCSGTQGWVFEVTPEGKVVWDIKIATLLPNEMRAGGKAGKGEKGAKGAGRKGKGGKGKGGKGKGGGGGGGSIFRAPFYQADYPAFKGRL